jgi:hypothetical protein
MGVGWPWGEEEEEIQEGEAVVWKGGGGRGGGRVGSGGRGGSARFGAVRSECARLWAANRRAGATVCRSC